MPIWPFKRRRANTLQNDAPSQQLSEKKAATAPVTRATTAATNTRATTPVAYSPTRSRTPYSNEPVTSATRPLAPRTPSTAAHQRAGSQTATVPIDIPRSRQGRRAQVADPEKENVRPIQDSREDVTALPVRRRLEQSPHLRTVSPDKPPIPYNFFGYSRSQTDVPRLAPVRQPSRTGTLSRKASQKSRKSRRDDPLREEEIRAMSAASPIPPVSRDELLRRESRKLRGKSSIVTLPAEGSIRSSMSGRIEQRGWEVGALAVLNPRPSVRLSGIQRVLPSSLPNSPSGILYRIDSIGVGDVIEEREPTPPSRGSRKKRRQLIGDKVDDLDASDLRVILERDAKRKERRRKEQQEKLERKLQSRAERSRADSDAVPIDADGELRAELIKARVEEERRARAMTPPTDVHPALRDPLSTSYFRENNSRAASPVPVSPISQVLQSPSASAVSVINEGTDLRYPPRGDIPQNPFVDHTDDERFETPMEEIVESPFDDPVVGTAREMRMSVASKPPPSPVRSRRPEGMPIADLQRHSLAETTSSVPDSAYRRSSVPAASASYREKRSAPWSSFFRRGNTIRQGAIKDVPSTSSFSNTSRESMRAAGIPAHLVDATPARPPTVRSNSGIPARTMSKFREDLPEMPTLLPESQDPASDVAIAAAAAHAARQHRNTPSEDTTTDANAATSDTGPTSPQVNALRRGHERIMSSSMASIDSEGSWLAGGSKRQSMQSGFSRSMSQRRAEFGASYEELGSGAVDRDAEYISGGGYARHTPLASPDIPDIDEAADPSSTIIEDDDAVPVAGTVRRRPTVVAASSAAARVQSREGLVSDFLSGDNNGEAEESPRISHASASEADSNSGSGSQRDGGMASFEVHQLQHAKSINYHERHSRQFSAGSARLLDVRKSTDANAVLLEETPRGEEKEEREA